MDLDLLIKKQNNLLLMIEHELKSTFNFSTIVNIQQTYRLMRIKFRHDHETTVARYQ